MFLLVGSADDPCCKRVNIALQAHGCATRIVENPLAHPARFSWRLNGERSASELVWDQAQALDEPIEGVLVRGAGWVDPAGWQAGDLAYMQAETQAALLAWLWSLSCVVVNRYTAALWYRSQLPVASWRPLLRRCGLSTPTTVVTNVDDEARAFGRHLAANGVPGAVYAPLTSDAQYLVGNADDWAGLTAMQRRAPVCLTCPHEQPRLLCVVGDRIVWDGAPPPEAAMLEPALSRFAAEAGLLFVEVAIAATAEGLRVVDINHHPRLDRFGVVAQEQIAGALATLLTASHTASDREPQAAVN